MVEELAEEGEHRVERRRQPLVGRDVADGQRAERISDGVRAGNRHRSRVAHGLIGDQVADDARLRVLHVAVLAVRRPILGGVELSVRHAGEELIGGAERLLTRSQVIERSVDRAQAERESRVVDLVGSWSEEISACRVRLRDLNLAEDESQVARVENEADSGGAALRANWCRAWTADARDERGDQHHDEPSLFSTQATASERIRKTHGSPPFLRPHSRTENGPGRRTLRVDAQLACGCGTTQQVNG